MEVGHALEQVRVAGGGQNRLPPPFSVFPTDLRNWGSQKDLSQIITEAVQRADHTGVRADFIPRWDSLLTQIAAAYMVGIFSSEEIATAAGECPIDGSAALRHFRRCNRLVLERTLASILQTCANKQHLTAVPWNGSVDPAACEAEARARIARAIEMDSWSVDDD